MLALGIIAPVFPKLVIQLEGGNEAGAAGAVGLFGTVWAAMQFVFAPVLGALSDRVGRRPVILVSCLGLGLDYAIMALAPTVGWRQPGGPDRSVARARGARRSGGGRLSLSRGARCSAGPVRVVRRLSLRLDGADGRVRARGRRRRVDDRAGRAGRGRGEAVG